jgi:ubiquinone/menaquinone biosynthesis C-methylase UbiE
MAADLQAILEDLGSCYDLGGRSVIHVGAGGGQLLAFVAGARGVLGVDTDAAALAQLETKVREMGLVGRYRTAHADVLSIREHADIVYFEFCLHEIVDAATALEHARTLAPVVLIADHAPGSSWSWYLCESEKVQRGWKAAERYPFVFDRIFTGWQRFHDHEELVAKVAVMGECALRRVEEFRGRRDFTIPMPYRVALLRR